MTAPPWTPGARLGDYVLRAPLGTGGSGEVWEAVLEGPHGFRKVVALKLLHPSLRGGDREDLLEEARLGARLQHPNIVGTLLLGEHEGQWFVVMERVRGVSTWALRRAGPLSGGAIVDIGVQACAGLHHAHTTRVHGGRALVHRDVKPANLLVDHTGLVKVADLGVATGAGESEESAGTPGYMAPEQLGGVLDPRTDLFGMGATLAALVTGRPPLGRGRGAVAALVDVEKHLAPELWERVDETAPGLSEVLKRCLAQDPEDRWPDALQLGQALQGLRSGQTGGESLLDALARVHPELPVATTASSLPTLRTGTDTGRGNLPRPRDAFVGRGALLDELGAALDEAPPLLTLHGAGGSGKTRLAVELARTRQERFPGGVWFCDLSEAQTVPAFCIHVARALSIRLGSADPVKGVARGLSGLGPALVIVDNLEQAIAAARDVLDAWTDAAPRVQLLATSRLPVGLRGERVVPVPPLEVEEGVALFTDRAPALRDEPDPADVRAIVEACGGLPLAIELAAARTRLLPVARVRASLSDALKVLAGGGPDRPDRHRSVRASLQGSWDLLSVSARAALAQLSVFDGGWTLEAAEAVLDEAALPRGVWALEVLQELVEASLVRVDAGSGRFGLPVVVCAFAREQLGEGSAAREAQVRHGRHFAQLGSPQALAALSRHGGQRRLAALTSELDNLLEASRRAVERRDAAVAVPTARAAARILQLRGPLSEGEPVLDAALGVADGVAAATLVLELAGFLQVLDARRAADLVTEALGSLPDAAPRELRAGLVLRRASLEHRLGDHERSGRSYAEGLQLARAAGDRHLACIGLANQASLLYSQGALEQSLEGFRASLELARAYGDIRSVGVLHGSLGTLLSDLGRRQEAEEHCEQAARIHRDLADERHLARVVALQGQLAIAAGDVRRADERLAEAARLSRALGDRLGEAMALTNHASLDLWAGRLSEARERIEAALDGLQSVGQLVETAVAWGISACAHLERGALDEAEVHLDLGTACVEGGDAPRYTGTLLGIRGELLRRRGLHDEARRALDEGEALLGSLSPTIERAHLLARRALVEADGGDPDLARVALVSARGVAAELDRRNDPELKVLLDRAEGALTR